MSFVRAAAVSIPVHVGNVQANVQEILGVMEKLREKGVQIAVFPELCLTGATAGDWFLCPDFQKQAWDGMGAITKATGDMAVVVGLPVSHRGRLFNCAAVLHEGEVKGLIPKAALSAAERRWFAPGLPAHPLITDAAFHCFLGTQQTFESPDHAFLFAVELGEDRRADGPASQAEIILNPSTAPCFARSHAALKNTLQERSRRLCAGYVCACAGFGESTTDQVFDGFTGICEIGEPLAEGERFVLQGSCAIADVDAERIRYQRQRTAFEPVQENDWRKGGFHTVLRSLPPRAGSLLRPISRRPFVPENLAEIAQMQATALATRLRAIRCEQVVLGVSGGLDSTLALLVAVQTFDLLGLDRSGIHALTLPGMATGDRTRTNAGKLIAQLGVSTREIAIGAAVRQHFADIGHDGETPDITYENSQARERTQILMDYANRVGGIVLGTGDLSEIALGFCTFGADHLSMYNVNASVPKTLVRALTAYLSRRMGVEEVCADIIQTPVSPELAPGQKTEDILGSYELHDFFLWHQMQSGAGREKLLMLACQAFGDAYDQAEITRALDIFLRRFRTQQFKRSCMPDGAQVTAVSLSPRGGWMTPSDLSN